MLIIWLVVNKPPEVDNIGSGSLSESPVIPLIAFGVGVVYKFQSDVPGTRPSEMLVV